ASEIERIFERFYRVDPARHRSTGGMGLGLSIVKHVAASHGGEVAAWSVEGEGSSLTLRLPRDTTSPTEPSAEPAADASPDISSEATAEPNGLVTTEDASAQNGAAVGVAPGAHHREDRT